MHRTSLGNSRFLFATCLICSCFLAYHLALWASQPRNHRVGAPSNDEATPATLLTTSHAKIDFGTITKGGKAEATIWLYNQGDQPVQLESVRTSCDCFSVDLMANVIPPMKSVMATAKVDLTDDPDFTGGLCLEAHAPSKNQDTPAFVNSAEVRVVLADKGN